MRGIVYGLLWKGSRAIVRSYVRDSSAASWFSWSVKNKTVTFTTGLAILYSAYTIRNVKPVNEGWKDFIDTSSSRLDCRRCTVAYGT